jgi:lysine-specific demethylase 8
MRGFASEWPATTKWGEIDVLARQFGHRLTPIEVGSISTGMEEELVTFRSFVSRYLSPSAKKDSWSLQDATSDASSKIAYLAQHPLLDQIQALYDDVETNPCGLKPTNVNVWIGTGGTRTPLHFDSYDNLLVQLVGAKYVRLYGPGETPKLYVAKDKSYGLQGNMSGVDCEKEDFEAHPLAKNCSYTEVLLLPGDCLFIPSRHWHYVRSLSTSISINYWF